MALTILDARVRFHDNDSTDTAELLVSRRPAFDRYDKRPAGRNQLSDEQNAIVGAELRGSDEGWHVYVAQDGPLVSMFTWGGEPDDGFGGWARLVRLADGSTEKIVGGWHPSSSVAEAAGFEPVVSISVFHEPESWERGYTGFAGFCRRDALLAAIEAHAPDIVPCESRFGEFAFRWRAQPAKHEWRAMERARITAEKIAWEAEHDRVWVFEEHHVTGEGFRDPRWEVRSYADLGPAPLPAPDKWWTGWRGRRGWTDPVADAQRPAKEATACG